jgi:adenine-specific DNA glycosylase
MAGVSHIDVHVFNEDETKEVQEKLLAWFDKSKRKMPWRDLVCTILADLFLYTVVI